MLTALLLSAALQLAPGVVDEWPGKSSQPFMLAQISPGRGGGGASLSLNQTWTGQNTYGDGLIRTSRINDSSGSSVLVQRDASGNFFSLAPIPTTSWTGVRNIAIGESTIQGGFNPSWNVAIGWGALTTLGGGQDNVALGIGALQGILNGTGNVAVGRNAGAAMPNAATNNLFLGFQAASAYASAATNCVAIGANAVCAGDNTITLGNSSHTATTLKGTVTAPSLVASTSLVVGASGTSTSGRFRATAVWNPGTITSGSIAQTSVTVTGALTTGDCRGAVLSTVVTGVSVACNVTAANTCVLSIWNPSASSLVLGSATFSCTVWNP